MWEKMQENISAGMHSVDEAERRIIKDTDGSREPNPWLKRTGWARYLGGLDQVKMRDLVRPADEHDDPELSIIHGAFNKLIRAAQKVAVTDVVGQAACSRLIGRKWVRSRVKPFNSRLSKSAFKAYTDIWKQLLSYIWRADDMEESDRPKYSFTSRQKVEFDSLVEVAEEASQESGVQARNRTEKAVQTQVLRFCISLLDHQLGDHQYQSAIISGLAVLGLDEGGGWVDAVDYTKVLSAVIKLARLMVVQLAHHTRQLSIARKVGRGLSQVDAEESVASHFDLVQQITRQFMVLVTSPGQPSPMDCVAARTKGRGMRLAQRKVGPKPSRLPND